MCMVFRKQHWLLLVGMKAQYWQRQVVNWNCCQRCWKCWNRMDIVFSSSHRSISMYFISLVFSQLWISPRSWRLCSWPSFVCEPDTQNNCRRFWWNFLMDGLWNKEGMVNLGTDSDHKIGHGLIRITWHFNFCHNCLQQFWVELLAKKQFWPF